jgi:alkanesulfonate monooxygenase SsuD/methylene tetrahydromethanopterin reductase-like flavin-dependent oxidoreductase (luciferase family)
MQLRVGEHPCDGEFLFNTHAPEAPTEPLERQPLVFNGPASEGQMLAAQLYDGVHSTGHIPTAAIVIPDAALPHGIFLAAVADKK